MRRDRRSGQLNLLVCRGGEKRLGKLPEPLCEIRWVVCHVSPGGYGEGSARLLGCSTLWIDPDHEPPA